MTSHKQMEEFERTALPHLKDLYRTALRLTGDASRAEDVVQETCLEALRSLGRFTSGTNMRAWMFGIMFNVARHQRRKLLKFTMLGGSGEGVEDRVPAPPVVPDRLTDGEILAALERLPGAFRDVVLLVDVEEFAYKEASAILKVPVGTVMSRLSRARAQLRRELAGSAQQFGIGTAAPGGTP